jgi:hypothetical protein
MSECCSPCALWVTDLLTVHQSRVRVVLRHVQVVQAHASERCVERSGLVKMLKVVFQSEPQIVLEVVLPRLGLT